MFGNDKILATAALAGGLAALAALAGCGREPSVASKSAAAFREAQKRGETFAGAAHSHGHGAVTPGGGPEAPDAAAGAAHHEHGAPGGHETAEEGAAGHAAMGHGGERHATGHAHGQSGGAAPKARGAGHPGGEHGGHAGMEHGRSSAVPRGRTSDPGARAKEGAHAGHGAMPEPTAEAGGRPSGTAPEGHAGHAPAPGAMPRETPATASAAASPGQPARTLRPDPLDAPAATSVVEARRSAEMAEEMTGHGGHGAGAYRQVDAGRGPGAYEGSEPQIPAAGQHQGHGPATPAPSGHEGHSHGSAGEAETAALYVCPMHPEVTSTAPGTCPRCGMALVERRRKE